MQMILELIRAPIHVDNENNTLLYVARIWADMLSQPLKHIFSWTSPVPSLTDRAGVVVTPAPLSSVPFPDDMAAAEAAAAAAAGDKVPITPSTASPTFPNRRS